MTALPLALGLLLAAPAASGGPFGLALIETPDNTPVDLSDFGTLGRCGACHPRQKQELQGSMHDIAHRDTLYRALAEVARAEAGDATYAYCSSCHSPIGVVTGLIPKVHDPELPDKAKAGVICDVCHQVSHLTGTDGPWREPGNASFRLTPGSAKFGPAAEIAEVAAHSGQKSEILGTSEFCASCHTVIHPTSGLRIEHTYGEWKQSVYAEHGIQCQDCHMRSVANAIVVADTLKPVVEVGRWDKTRGREDRPIRRHYFVGGNVNAAALGGGEEHAAMAEERLKSVARLTLSAPDRVAPASPLAIEVAVTNLRAGHNIPTGVTELRQMWVELIVRSADGAKVFGSGEVGPDGEIPDGAIRFGSTAVDSEGRPTYKLWEMARFSWHRTIAPRATEKDTRVVQLADKAAGPVTIEARLLYRSLAPRLAREIMGDAAITPRIVEMATASRTVAIQSPLEPR